MKKIYAFLFSFLIISFTSLKAYDSDPEIFVKELVNDAMQKLVDKNSDSEEKEK